MMPLFSEVMQMGLGLFGFLVLIALEIWSIVKVSHYWGCLATLVLLAAGVIFGLQLMRSQGIKSLMQTAQNIQSGQSPLGALAAGIVKAFAGILLIMPGFFSDLLALIILLPFVQDRFADYLLRKAQFQGFASGGFSTTGFGSGKFSGFSANDATGNIYEHEGSAEVADVKSAEVIEFKPKQK